MLLEISDVEKVYPLGKTEVHAHRCGGIKRFYKSQA